MRSSLLWFLAIILVCGGVFPACTVEDDPDGDGKKALLKLVQLLNK